MLARLDAGSAAARRGMSDLAIRNLFIIPTIVFLIVFNIFPLHLFARLLVHRLPRLGERSRPTSSACRTTASCSATRYIWNNFTITAKYVLVSVGGQVLVGFGVALLLNRAIRGKGLVTTLLLLPMMMSMAVVGLFWQLLYSPSWGIINYALRLEDFDWLSDPDVALYAVAHHRHLDVVAVRDAAVARRPVGDPASTCTRPRRSIAPAAGTPSRASRCRWSRRCC